MLFGAYLHTLGITSLKMFKFCSNKVLGSCSFVDLSPIVITHTVASLANE